MRGAELSDDLGFRFCNIVLLTGILFDVIEFFASQQSPALRHRGRVSPLDRNIDTLRADHMEAYGYDRRTAPVFDRLASSGVRFQHALSQAPWTLPSMASLHTSLYPSQHGAVGADTALPQAAETLAERLGTLGYHTVAVVSHEFITANHGFAQGFDVFDESNVVGHEAVTSTDLTLTALARLGGMSEPFFLWVHYFDPHFTYVRHSKFSFADGYEGGLELR